MDYKDQILDICALGWFTVLEIFDKTKGNPSLNTIRRQVTEHVSKGRLVKTTTPIKNEHSYLTTRTGLIHLIRPKKTIGDD